MSNSLPKAVNSTGRQPLPAVAVFARGISPGRVKTRLIPLLGARGAADLHAALISDTVRKVDTLEKRVSRYFFLGGRAFPSPLSGYSLMQQRGQSLGERLERAFQGLLRRHRVAVVVGTDSPAWRAQVLLQAFRELRSCDAVLGPSPDGGYYLLGLRRQERRRLSGVFHGVRWGSRFAFQDTVECFLRQGFICSILEPCDDVDRPEDFHRLARRMARCKAARRAAPAVWRYVKRLRPEGTGATPRRGIRPRHRK